MTSLTDRRIRRLSVNQLQLELPPGSAATSGPANPRSKSAKPPQLTPPFPEGDPFLVRARELLDQYGGLILVGPPGTSKTWSARRLALTLAGGETRVQFIQFHPSYQYEDFVQGYVPKKEGFRLEPKHLLRMAESAKKSSRLTYVLVIDELSRGDAARIFGEGLTYVEKSMRGVRFSLPSGRSCSIPPNLLFIATMNPLDRGVDDVDAAFERRFAKVPMDPNPDVLRTLLDEAGLPEPLRRRAIAFFRDINKRAQEAPQTALGHTFFMGMDSEAALRRLWDHQLRFFFIKAYRLDPRGYEEVRAGWNRIFAPAASASGQEEGAEP
jgi:5-methylcytosine-specific restriction protein B